MNKTKVLKHLIISGAFLASLSGFAQIHEPWYKVSKGGINDGLGMVEDSSFLYFGSNLRNAPFDSYVYRINRFTKEKDSLLITNSDSASFLPFFFDIHDSLVVLIGSMYNWTASATSKDDRRTTVVRITKDLRFKDSLVFGSEGFDVMNFLQLQDKYFISEGAPASSASGKLTKINMTPLSIDTSITLDDSNGGHYDKCMVFNQVLEKLFVISKRGKAFLIDTTYLTVDSTFFPWNSSFPYAPEVRDLFSWNGSTMALASPWGMRLYNYNDMGEITHNYPITNQDTLSGAEAYVRGCFGFSDSLLIFSTSGPFTAPPPQQTSTNTYVRVYAINKTGDIIWQTKIENGRNNLVHSQTSDDENTFLYVRSIQSGQQEMYVYKVDDKGNLLLLSEDQGYKKIGIHFYPNPSQGMVSFDASGMLGEVEEITFELYNVHGQRCFQQLIAPTSGSFDLNRLPPGTYSYNFKISQEVVRNGLLILQ